MSDLSPNLALPYMLSAQAQKHVTHNEALERLDVLAQLVLESFAAPTPPAAPAEGEAHGIGAGAGGAWSGQDGRIAAWLGGAWVFLDPGQGWRAWGRAEAELRVWDGTAWAPVAEFPDSVDGLGVNAAWDSVNRLAVASEAALFSHAGAGHQLKINKAGPADTGSILYQTNWSGRAEMGLAGSEDFAIKVSQDGTAWNTALKIDAASGIATLPQGMDGLQFEVGYDAVAAIPTPSKGGFMVLSVVDPVFPQCPASGIFAYDTGSSPLLLTVWRGSSLDNLGTTVLTGTTGTAGNVSVGVLGDGNLYVENRYQSSGSRQFCITWMNGFRQL